jgi:hypothetical protein
MLRLIATLCFALAAVAPAPGQGVGQSAGEAHPTALERWSELPPERRAALRERFHDFQELDDVQRAELRARHERLREAERRVRAELDPEAAAAFERLEPSARREFLRERLAHEFERCGARVAGLLPDDVRARLESASPGERMHLMRALRGRNEDEQLGRGLEELGGRLGLSEAEIAAFADLSPDARKQKLFELRRREVDARVAREGPPAWIPADEWRAMQELDDREFCSRLRSCRWRGRGDDGPPELGRLLRPDPDWLADLEALPEAERRAELERRLAARLLGWLEEHPEAPLSADLGRLRTLAPRELLESVRHGGRGKRGPRERGDRAGQELR